MQRRTRYTVVVLVAIGLCASATFCWAGMQEGLLAHERGDYATALREFRLLAEPGDTAARFFLGHMYFKGQGVPQDDAQAAQWYRRAAEQSHAEAQYNLGTMYASLLIAQGESLAYIRDQMGHHSIQVIVDVYGHLVPGGNKAAVDRLDDAPQRNLSATSQAG